MVTRSSGEQMNRLANGVEWISGLTQSECDVLGRLWGKTIEELAVAEKSGQIDLMEFSRKLLQGVADDEVRIVAENHVLHWVRDLWRQYDL